MRGGWRWARGGGGAWKGRRSRESGEDVPRKISSGTLEMVKESEKRVRKGMKSKRWDG